MLLVVLKDVFNSINAQSISSGSTRNSQKGFFRINCTQIMLDSVIARGVDMTISAAAAAKAVVIAASGAADTAGKTD